MHLVNHRGFARVRFAGPLKAMMAALGCTNAEIDGDRKEVPCDLLGGKSPRWAMQTLGTEWGRKLIGDDLVDSSLATRRCPSPGRRARGRG
jgi:hypothetical protein